MRAKHLLRAAFAGVVLLGVCLIVAEPTDGHAAPTAYESLSIRAIDRTDVPWQASAVEDPDHIRAF
ncbi:MAG TPA: hypothetical protein VEH51_08135 [Burkholderiales bacterium]|nr:hypothetical protein [Burkholderiales bacterium]